MAKMRTLFITLCILFILKPQSRAAVLDTQDIYNQAVLALQIQGEHPDSAYHMAQEIEKVSLAHNYQKGLAFAYMRMGFLENIWGQNDRAKNHIHQVIQIRKDLEDFEGATYACITLSYIYEETGESDSAFLVMYDALQYQEQTTNELLLGSIHLQLAYLGTIFDHEPSEILEHFEIAENIAESANDSLSLVEVYNQMGIYYYNKDNYDEALSFYLQANELITTDSTRFVSNYNNLATCYEAMGAYQTASNYYRKVINLSKRLHNPVDEADAYFNMGVMYHNIQNNDSAQWYFTNALHLFQLTQNKVDMSKTYHALAASYAQIEDYKTALDYQEKYSELNQEIINEKRVNSISEMRVKYDTQQKELALQLSQEEEKAQKAQKKVFITGSIILALLLILLLLIYLQKQRVNAKNRLLQKQKMQGLLDVQEVKTYQAMMQGQEEERLRISADLHDRLGSMLSTVKLLFSGLEDKLDRQQGENQKQYDKAKYIIDDACTEIRRISHNLGAGMVANFGLANAIHELCDSINQSDSLQCHFTSHNLPSTIPLKVETELYRIVQETFNNVIKHAKASEIHIQLNGHEKEINLLIEDNGVGFDASNPKTTHSLGLKSIQNRVSLLEGSYHLDTVIGRGTTFIIDIPINWTDD